MRHAQPDMLSNRGMTREVAMEEAASAPRVGTSVDIYKREEMVLHLKLGISK